MCNVCNGRRGNKEALISATGVPLTIDRIFHPLVRSVKECVELQYYSRDLEPERLQFVDLPTQLDTWNDAVGVYSMLYEIPQRWKEQWNVIDSVIGTQVRSALEAHRYTQQRPITLIDFDRILTGVISSLEEPNARYLYPAQRWLVWAKQYKLERLYEAHVKTRGMHC